MHFGCILLLAMYVSAVAFLLISCAGCAIGSGFNVGFRRDNNLQLYDPWDNSSSVGPNYLVGPPGHNFRYGGRVNNGSSLQGDDPILQSIDKLAKTPPPLPVLP
jgi:hypothetical protein